jgi:uncharacterized protein
MGQIFERQLQLPDLTKHSVFLWGPRKTGKSYWIRHNVKQPIYLDLLQSDIFAEYSSRPSLLRERYQNLQIDSPGTPIVIDEVQKCPALLDEAHWLIENRSQTFLLTGSSARKLRRSHANLLGGRARRREMRPLCYPEIASQTEKLDFERLLFSGLIPSHYLSLDPADDLRAYLADYLKEEVAQEALVRNLPAFSEFLRVAALTSSELLNYTNVGRETGVSAKVVKGYFEILEDTLLGLRIAPWRKSKKRRLVETERFYLFDVGVSNFLCRRRPKLGTPEFGKSFEHYLLMELLAYKSYRDPELEVSFWRTSNGQEVDFLLNDKEVALEVKGSERSHSADTRGLSCLSEDGPVKKRIIVCLEREPRSISDRYGKILVWPCEYFLKQLWGGSLVG